jgi:hypothetical protein
MVVSSSRPIRTSASGANPNFLCDDAVLVDVIVKLQVPKVTPLQVPISKARERAFSMAAH